MVFHELPLKEYWPRRIFDSFSSSFRPMKGR